MRIESLQNKKVKELVKLYQNKKYRDEENLFIIEGYHMVKEAYDAKLLKEVYSLDEIDFDFDNVTLISKEILAKVTDVVTPQGIIGVCNKKTNFNLSNRVLLLDNIQDPGNLGTLIRSAVGFGFSSIILDDCVDVYNPKVIRSTQGAIFKVDIKKESIIDFIKNNVDYVVYGTSLQNGVNLSSVEDNIDKLGIILGNEGNGVRKEILDITNKNIFIEINNLESLNVGVAGSIIMYKYRYNSR